MSSRYHERGYHRALLSAPVRNIREWLRNPAYRALQRFYSVLSDQGNDHHPVNVDYQGLPIFLADVPSFLSAWDEIFVNRIYHVKTSAVLPVLVDAGANIGLAALYWKMAFGSFRYVGFEPDPAIAALCRKNLALWNVTGDLHELALGSHDGTAIFLPDGADGGHLHTATLAQDGAIGVKLSRLSNWLPDSVDLLKIDVEGAESDVLTDIEPHLGKVSNLFVEWHSRHGQAGLGEALSLLHQAGFDCHLQSLSGRTRPFEDASDPGPFYQCLNIYAVRH